MISYSFDKIINCEICNSEKEHHKILGIRLNQSQGFNPKNKVGIATGVKKCKICNLIFSDPLPIPNKVEDHYNLSENYFQNKDLKWKHGYLLEKILFVKKLLPFVPGMKALDVGAGAGQAMKTLEIENFDTFGCEPAKDFYNYAIKENGVLKNKIKLGKIEDIDYEENFFDFISFDAVLEHFYKPRFCVEKALKWLKPNGIIQIEVPSCNWVIAKLINLYFFLIRSNYVTNLSPMHNPYHLYEFDLKTFQTLGEKVGFNVECYKYDVGEVLFIPKFLHPIFKWYMKKTNTGLVLTVYLRKK